MTERYQEIIDALVAGNGDRFNSLRRGPSEVFVHERALSEINFRQFDLTNMLFVKLSFDRCTFEGLSSVNFVDCVFNRCQFKRRPQATDERRVKNVWFLNCAFASTKFRTDFENVEFRATKFEHCDFAESQFTGRLSLRNCLGFSSSRGLLYTERNLSALTYSENRERPVVRAATWERLRFILEIPLTKFSWMFFLLNGFLVGLAYIALHMRGAVVFVPASTLGEVLGVAETYLLNSAMVRSASQNVVLSLLLLAGSVAFKLACPNEVAAYSRRQWVYELKQPEFIYEHISTGRTALRYPSALLIVATISLLAAKYAATIGSTVFEVLSLSLAVARV